jgi:Ras-related GTP-binding protein C/D
VTDESETSAFDSQSSSVIRLNNSTIIFMKEVSNVLAMICIWREENFGKSGNF